MMNTENKTPKKAPRRFMYPTTGYIEVNNVHQPTQIQNISKTGIQFASTVPIPKNARIHLMWQDSKLGAMESYVTVVRDIDSQPISGFSYCYGSKFINARQDVKKNVNRLVENVREEHRQSDQKLLEKVPFKTIGEIIRHGTELLRVLSGGKRSVVALVNQYVDEFKDYEKLTFKKSDEYSVWVQKIVMHYFHCRLLTAVLSSMELRMLKTTDAPKIIEDKLRIVPNVIAGFERFLQSTSIDENPIVSRQANETLNRLIYSYLELSESFTRMGHLKTRAY